MRDDCDCDECLAIDAEDGDDGEDFSGVILPGLPPRPAGSTLRPRSAAERAARRWGVQTTEPPTS